MKIFIRFLSIQLFLVMAVLASSVWAEPPKDGKLTEESYHTWRDHVLPRSWEFKYQRIGWRPSYWEAVIEAQEKDLPILLWAMNGHPLCNT